MGGGREEVEVEGGVAAGAAVGAAVGAARLVLVSVLVLGKVATGVGVEREERGGVWGAVTRLTSG